ncbi:hypothetical protein EGW08_005343 [Elysia chlorotica]|uniref:Uncharacterized protein n=1 Tax=Elysia chlorotica TaxID=188477 RepID=A0A433TZN4_ELYCH|nr:hypothetical protein EGW08_005343 [Elysia chlorotica]
MERSGPLPDHQGIKGNFPLEGTSGAVAERGTYTHRQPGEAQAWSTQIRPGDEVLLRAHPAGRNKIQDRMVYPNRLGDIAPTFRRCQTDISLIASAVLHHIYGRFHRKLDTLQHRWLDCHHLAMAVHHKVPQGCTSGFTAAAVPSILCLLDFELLWATPLLKETATSATAACAFQFHISVLDALYPLHPSMIASGKVHGRELVEKFYPDGKKFITMFPDGTGNVLYPFN